MLVSIIIILLLAFSGLALTYVLVEDEPLMWRLAAGSIIGWTAFGLVAFVVACLVGFSPVTIIASLVVTLLMLLLLRRPDISKRFLHDWAKAKGTLSGASLKKSRRFAYYAFFFLVFLLFFGQAVYQTNDGIYTGASQNLGDLPFHLGAIFSFTDGNNFPPQNPSWAGAKFSYPFMSDFLAACMVKLGAGFVEAMFAQNLAWAFALLVILERFVLWLTNNKLAGRIAPALLFFSGGLGFLWFFKDSTEITKGLTDFLWHLPRDYTIGDQFRWGNSMLVLFITQRGLLLGMPLTLLVLGFLWKIFGSENQPQNESGKVGKVESEKNDNPVSSTSSHSPIFLLSPFLIGLIAGTLPLIHVHSLFVLFVVTAFLFIIRPEKWREWVAFGVGTALVAVPELIWTMTGSATDSSKFFGWHFGWDKRDENIFWFWLKNTGIFIPVLIAAVCLVLSTRRRGDAENADAATPERKDAAKKRGSVDHVPASPRHALTLALFLVPFIFLFLLSNVAKLAPWEWDNIKILIYWFAGSIPLVALAIAWAWQKKGVWKIAAGVCFIALIFSGALDVWRTASGHTKMRIFDADSILIAEQIKKKTAPNALFLNAPTYNSAVVLSGRPSLMRYSGHLVSYGIDYGPREADVKRIYEGGGVAGINLEKYNVEYALLSAEERNSLKANEEFFKKYPVIAEVGAYRVYKIK